MTKTELEIQVRSIILSGDSPLKQYGRMCSLLADYFADTSCNPPTKGGATIVPLDAKPFVTCQVCRFQAQYVYAIEAHPTIHVYVCPNRHTNELQPDGSTKVRG